MPRVASTLLCLLTLALLSTARGELVLTNFTAGHPLKVMAVGDSITDDCSFNGAWRQYLQPLLETNGYEFTFIGRQSSSLSGNFTKTLHEGYCGAVIAAPGVFGAHQYSAGDNYLIKIVPEALSNATPDLVLLLIGANDIGRGRDPGLTATNDMSALLNIIFSNAPNVNVIISKISTMQNADNIGGLNYGAYAANVPIYNAALQTLVNQRRDAGQNLFLADMFSVLNNSSLINSDHLHPSLAGLQVMAGEWLTRIKSITIRSNPVVSVLVRGGDNWKYFDHGQDLGTDWAQPAFDDSGWSNSPARLGFGDSVAATIVGYGPDPNNKYPTIYFRHPFVVPDNVKFTNLVLRLAQRGGSRVWLNGQELWRTNLPAGNISYTDFASSFITTPDGPYQFNAAVVDATKLVPGTNVITEELHLVNKSFSVAGFDMELVGTGIHVSPTLSLATAGTNLVFSWPAASGGGFGLYSSTNLGTTNWTPTVTPTQTNGGQLVVTQAIDSAFKFFRLQTP